MREKLEAIFPLLMEVLDNVKGIFSSEEASSRTQQQHAYTARSYETVSNGTAKSNDLKYKYDAQLQLFKALKNSTNMSSAELLQYVWLQTMRKTSSGDLFVDYKKVPLFAEVGYDGKNAALAGGK